MLKKDYEGWELKFFDNSKNIYDVDSFLYEIDKDLLKIKNVKFKDINNNRFTSFEFLKTRFLCSEFL